MEEKNNLLDDKALAEVFQRFQKNNPDPKPELYAPNAYCFLLSVVLSAQATDKSVNAATEPLFKIADTPEAILALGKEKLIHYIKQVGLYNAKSEHIIELSKKLVSDFDSKVPSTREELMSLPGVGRKTANVVLNVIFHKPTMPVDTHLLRVCPKTGIAGGKTPLEVEKSLEERVPQEFANNAHHWILLHGRYTCTARNPKCGTCIINDLCLHNTADTNL